MLTRNPIVYCNIKLRVCSVRFQVLELLYARAKETGVISLDSEWQPEYAAHEHNKIALLQLGIRDDVFLLQLVHMSQPLPEVLGRLLSDPNVVKVGCSIKTDCKVCTAALSEL